MWNQSTPILFFFAQPETIPQASINMSDVIEVADAEQITGHTHSILIQTPDRSTFVKGTCQEESKWWYNVLVQLVKSKVRHHKRNAFLKGQNQKCKYAVVWFLERFLIDQCLGRRDTHTPTPTRGIVWELSDITGCLQAQQYFQFNRNSRTTISSFMKGHQVA